MILAERVEDLFSGSLQHAHTSQCMMGDEKMSPRSHPEGSLAWHRL